MLGVLSYIVTFIFIVYVTKLRFFLETANEKRGIISVQTVLLFFSLCFGHCLMFKTKR